MKRLLLVMLLQLGPGQPMIKEPAKTGTRYPVPTGCRTMTVTTNSYIVSSSYKGKTDTKIDEPLEIICEK